jgi:hypothetical protein
MKTFTLFLTVVLSQLFLFQQEILSDEMGHAELLIKNETNSIEIKVIIYPASAVFNGDREYSAEAISIHQQQYLYITGGEKILDWANPQYLPRSLKINFDKTSNDNENLFSVGYGLYLIKFYKKDEWSNWEEEEFDYCYVDWRDALYPYSANPLVTPYPRNHFTNDIKIYIHSLSDIKFQFYGGCGASGTYFFPISDAGRHIKIWGQTSQFGCGNHPAVIPETGIFTTDQDYLTNWPLSTLDGSAYANPNTPGKFHLNPDKFANGLQVDNRNVTLKSNGKLDFGVGAKFISNNSTYTSSSTWQGIKLTNPNSSTINACTFNNSEKPLSIINDNSYYANKKHHITNNTFNLPQGTYNSGTCFTGRNLFKINFQNNTLNGHTSNTSDRGIYFSNLISPSHPTGDGEGAGATESYDLKFTGNTIHNLTLGTMFINSASALAEINFLNNNYTGSKSNLVFGLNAIKTKGNFKNNKFLQSGNYYNFGMIFQLSNPDLYNNLMQSYGATLSLAFAHPKMAPYRNLNNQFVWNSGSNSLYSVDSDNIKILNESHPFTDFGNNDFTSNNFHINGYLSETHQSASTYLYHSRGNCWYPNGSASVNITNPAVTFNYLPTGTFCSQMPIANDVIINDLGDGVYDTILISIPDSIAELEIDEMYYAQALDLVNSGNYYNASQNLKWLVNDCMESEFRYSSLYDLYSYYERMDTSSNPGISYGLWNELYDYLLLKIEQYVEDYDFQDIAYNLSIMSQVNMQEYEDAMSKYEGIILEHPDPVQRLMASWDYDALVELLDTSNYGQGGSMRDFNFENSMMAFAGKNFDDLEPVQKTIHQNYRDRRIENERKREDRVNDFLSNEPNAQRKDLAEEMRREGIKREIESRARINMLQSRYLSREEKENRMMEDINLMIQLMDGNSKGMESPSFTPQTYKLEQNYPNPFNPSTIISFSIPTASLVKLNVYDITGKLIKVLSNEIKEAGIHNITFDGSGLASGVYFYKLEASPSAGSGTNYNQTKRMVMIK